MKTRICEDGAHLLVICEGIWKPGEVTELLRSINERAIQTSHDRILMDWFNMSAPNIEFHRFLAGVDVAEIIRSKFKIAVLYPKHLINKFTENVAVNRGANFFVCCDEEEAIKWLHS